MASVGQSFTVMVVPDQSASVRRYRVQRSWLVQIAAGLGVLVLGLLVAAVHYVSVARDASENRTLRDENLVLKTQLKSLRERVEQVGSTLDRVERFDQKLRAVTLLSEPQRNLGMGPTDAEPGVELPATRDNPFALNPALENPKALGARLEELSATAARQEQSLQELTAYFQDQRSLLASAPSIWPAKGLVTSDFGQRMDPYTTKKVMHSGLDIAAPHGREVMAPAEGTVVFSGLEGAYGNVLVIDHGYGIKTRYGHLAKLSVKAGDRVKRGQLVAAVGSTGRSTGPHLHYEVRVNGIPHNPRKFIFDDL